MLPMSLLESECDIEMYLLLLLLLLPGIERSPGNAFEDAIQYTRSNTENAELPPLPRCNRCRFLLSLFIAPDSFLQSMEQFPQLSFARSQ
jgi:hypothetical protein